MMIVIKQRPRKELMTSDSAISFDFWNTLYADGAENNRIIRRKALFRNAVKQYRPITDYEVNKVFDLSFSYFINEWKEKMRTPTAQERISLMSRYLNIDLPEMTISGLSEDFGRLILEIPPIEINGVRNVIRSLAKEFPLGIISDTGYIAGRHIRNFLEKEGILNCFRSFMFSDEQPHSKPHASVFKNTAEQLGVSLGNLIHVGDLERTDIHGAAAAGCQSIKFTGANHHPSENSEATLVTDSYKAVLIGIKSLLSRDN
jgi:FMN phosphatase YigB (HAD superfamily)